MRPLSHVSRCFPSVAIVALLVAVSPGTASATAVTTNVPATGAAVSPCVPPGAYVSGHIQLMTRFEVNLNGLHVGTETNSCGTKLFVPGLGDFISNETHFHEANTGFINGASEFTIHDSYRYIAKDIMESYKLDVMLHVTINANGEVTAEVDKITIDCFIPCCGG